MTTVVRDTRHTSSEDFSGPPAAWPPTDSSPDGGAGTATAPAISPDDRDTERALVAEYLPLAHTIANRYRHRGVDFDDLEQVARLALVKAARRWRPDRGRFVSYARPTIDGELKRYFRDSGTTIKIPRLLYEAQPRVAAATQALRQRLSHEPTDAEIADESGIPLQQVRDVHHAVSTCQPLTTDDAEHGSVDVPRERAMLEPSDMGRDIDLQAALCKLEHRDKRVLALRFVWGMSQCQIAAHIGVSQMQVSRILRAALGQLRQEMGAEGESSSTGAEGSER